MAPTIPELDQVVQTFYEGRGEQVSRFCLVPFVYEVYRIYRVYPSSPYLLIPPFSPRDFLCVIRTYELIIYIFPTS